jgi:hypothetical protein
VIEFLTRAAREVPGTSGPVVVEWELDRAIDWLRTSYGNACAMVRAAQGGPTYSIGSSYSILRPSVIQLKASAVEISADLDPASYSFLVEYYEAGQRVRRITEDVGGDPRYWEWGRPLALEAFRSSKDRLDLAFAERMLREMGGTFDWPSRLRGVAPTILFHGAGKLDYTDKQLDEIFRFEPAPAL